MRGKDTGEFFQGPPMTVAACDGFYDNDAVRTTAMTTD